MGAVIFNQSKQRMQGMQTKFAPRGVHVGLQVGCLEEGTNRDKRREVESLH